MRIFRIVIAGIYLIGLVSCKQQQKAAEISSDYENAAIENIMTRRSIRKYAEGPVARETMQTIMECGINAPSGQNKQSWEVRIVDNPDTMKEIIS
ncbi:MAG: nitroreductase family protein, partial [Bacteroidales bacterium]|nr:nitroreductase family protein [Bacteroidales bacterium]